MPNPYQQFEQQHAGEGMSPAEMSAAYQKQKEQGGITGQQQGGVEKQQQQQSDTEREPVQITDDDVEHTEQTEQDEEPEAAQGDEEIEQEEKQDDSDAEQTSGKSGRSGGQYDLRQRSRQPPTTDYTTDEPDWKPPSET